MTSSHFGRLPRGSQVSFSADRAHVLTIPCRERIEGIEGIEGEIEAPRLQMSEFGPAPVGTLPAGT